MKRRWIQPVSITLLSLLLALLVAEGAVRIVESKNVLREDFVRHDRVFHHRFIPGARGYHKTTEFNASYAINALGLREREISRAKPEGVKRLILLGDSFTEGNGVEAKETFAARLQSMVDGAGLATRWQVLNAGQGSYSPLIEYLMLKTELIHLEPDLVILNLDLSDVYDDIQYTKLAVLDSAGEPTAVPGEPERKPETGAVGVIYRLKNVVKENTRLYNFLYRRIAPRFVARPDDSGDVRADKYAMLRDGYNPGDGADWALTFGYIGKIRDLLAARGIPLWLTVYPYAHQISPREWHHGRTFWSFKQNRVYSTAPQRQVVEFGRRMGIPVIDMTDDFLRRSKTEFPLYFPFDGHFTPAGHAVAAEAIFRSLLPALQSPKADAAGARQDASLR